MVYSRRKKLALASALGVLSMGRFVTTGMRPNPYYAHGTITTRNNFKRALNTHRAKHINSPARKILFPAGSTRKTSNVVDRLIETVAPNYMRPSLRTLSSIIKPAITTLNVSKVLGNSARRAGGVLINLPALKLTIDLSKVPGFNKIAIKEFTRWSSMQLAMSKMKVPLSVQDEWNELKTIDTISQVFKTNPTLSAEMDPYGIAPGTHLAMPYKKEWKYATVGKGVLGKFGRQKMRLLIPGWSDDSKFFSGLNALFHHGVYVGNGMVMHVGGGGLNRMRQGTHTERVGLDTLATMTALGKGLYVVEHARTLDKHQIMYNLLRAPGAWNYDMRSKNCEHWATETVTGIPMSSQVERFTMNMFVLVALITAGSVNLLLKDPKKHRTYVCKMYADAHAIARTAIHALESKAYWNSNGYTRYATKLAGLLREPINAVASVVHKAMGLRLS
jgi:hypothetical protein